PGGPRKAFRSGGQGDLAAGTGGAGGASSQLRRLRHREGGIDAPDPAGARRAGCPGPRLRPSSGGAPLSRLRRLLRPPRGQPARRRHRRPPHEQAEGRWAARGLPLPPGGPPRRARIGAAARGRAVAHRGAAGLFAAPAHPPRGRSGVGAGPAIWVVGRGEALRKVVELQTDAVFVAADGEDGLDGAIPICATLRVVTSAAIILMAREAGVRSRLNALEAGARAVVPRPTEP